MLSVTVGRGARSGLETGPRSHMGTVSWAGQEQGHSWGEQPCCQYEREVEGKAAGTGRQPGLLVTHSRKGEVARRLSQVAVRTLKAGEAVHMART